MIQSTHRSILAVCCGVLAATTTPVFSQNIHSHPRTNHQPADVLIKPAYPFPQHVAYSAGTIRPNHRSQDIQDNDVIALYEAWKGRYLIAAGTEPDGHPRYRILHHRDPQGDTVSEGMGYGMLIVAYMAGQDHDAKMIFDGLYEYVLDHPSVYGTHLMDWNVPADESSNPPDDDSAFDGDSDIAYALLLASAQWGDQGRFNYQNEASLVLDAMMQRTVGANSNLPLLGDWVNEPGDEFDEYDARTSDIMPNHFHAFARFTKDPRWNDVALACQSAIEHIQMTNSIGTGLLPDFFVSASANDHTPVPAPAFFIEGPNDGRYEYNACRDPWRLATDALLEDNPVSRVQALRIAIWSRLATGANPNAIYAGYRLDGTPVSGSDYFSAAFAAPLAVAAMLDPEGQDWLNALYDSIRSSDDEYYEDTLSVLCMMILSGNWWDPTLVP